MGSKGMVLFFLRFYGIFPLLLLIHKNGQGPQIIQSSDILGVRPDLIKPASIKRGFRITVFDLGFKAFFLIFLNLLGGEGIENRIREIALGRHFQSLSCPLVSVRGMMYGKLVGSILPTTWVMKAIAMSGTMELPVLMLWFELLDGSTNFLNRGEKRTIKLP